MERMRPNVMIAPPLLIGLPSVRRRATENPGSCSSCGGWLWLVEVPVNLSATNCSLTYLEESPSSLDPNLKKVRVRAY